MCAIFEFWWNNFLMGIKFNFKFESWENFTKDFHVKKKVLWFCWNLAHIKFTIFKCAKFSSFGESTFLWEWNSILRFGKIFTKDFHVKKNTWEFLVKWTKIRIQWDSFVKFSVGGSRSIYRGIPYKIEDEKFYKGFPCKKII